MKRLFTLIIFGFILSSSACHEQVILQSKQEVFFEARSEQFAWGRNVSGIYITSDGSVLYYHNPNEWKHIEEETPADIVETNLKIAKVSSIKIDSKQLSEYTSLIPKLDKATLGKPIQKGADQGSLTFYAIRFNPEQKTYSAQLLSQKGDFTINNSDTNANKISDWLVDILTEVRTEEQKEQ